MLNLKNKVFLITGAGSGLGHHLAVALGRYAATIAVNDINPDRASRTVRLVEEAGGKAKSYISDVAKKFPVQALFNEIEDDWGRLDGLVNNARVVPHKPLLDMDEWDWRRTIDVNLTGAFVLTQVGGRLLRSTGEGVVIQLLQTLSDDALTTAYQASTGGVEQLITHAASELRSAGISAITVRYHDSAYEEPTQKVLEFLQKHQSAE